MKQGENTKIKMKTPHKYKDKKWFFASIFLFFCVKNDIIYETFNDSHMTPKDQIVSDSKIEGC